MMAPKEIRIGGPTGSLTFARARTVGAAESLVWTLQVPGLRAADEVWLPEWLGGDESLTRFFADLAEAWRGWEGTKAWPGGDGEVRLAATHDGVGQVLLFVTLRAHWHGQPPFADEWTATGVLAVEPGALDGVARGVAALIGVAVPRDLG
jgi:hypothetical protein